MPAQKGRVQGGAHQLPAGDERHVCALPHGEGLVHLEVFRHRIVHVLHGISSHPDVGWLVVLHQDFQQGLGEKPVAGQVHPQAGDGGQGRDVLGAVVGHAQGPVADAPGDADELYIGVGVGHVHLHLLHAAGGEEAGRGGGEGPQCCNSSPFSLSGWRTVQSAKKEGVRFKSAASAITAVMAPWMSVSHTTGRPSSFKRELAAQGMMPSSPCRAFQHWMATALQPYWSARRRIAPSGRRCFPAAPL